MILQNQLSAENVRQMTLEVLKRHLALQTVGYKCNGEMLMQVLLKAATERMSIEAVCHELSGLAASNTIRVQLNKALTVKQLSAHEHAMNAALTEWLPDELFQNPIELAIDTHDEPFYGKSVELEKYVCRGAAKAGTTHFIRIATAYVIWRQVRLTLAVTFVHAGEKMLIVLKRLVKRLRHLPIRWHVLYLDKGFCNTRIIGYLSKRGYRAIIACPIRGKTGGIRALCTGRKGYTTRYTFSDGYTATLALYPSLVPDKTGKRRRKWVAYILIHIGWLPTEVYSRYRRRFGIECSFRSMRKTKALTTSRNPALRFFLLGLSLLLQNIWIRIRHFVARVPGVGPRRVNPNYFTFRRFIAFLARAIEVLYQPILTCSFLCPSESVKY